MTYGKLNLILGCMFSGKTSELRRRYERYILGGKSCVMIKYKNDTRYDDSFVVTHDGVQVEAIPCTKLEEISDIIKDYDVVCVDEVQFYYDAHIYCDKWANDGKIVEACGLNGQYNRQPWPIISKLIPLVENITFETAVCRENGNDAVFTQLLSSSSEANVKDGELIGGSELYRAVDRETYFEKR